MMEREWKGILTRHGQSVRVDGRTVRAFLQPILDRDVQLVPSPLGLRREEQALYLGPAGVPLVPRESVVVWKEATYAVRSAREVGDGHHVWAILQRMEGET